MKKLMVAVAASAMAMCSFADAWFDAGVAEGWPNAASMTGGGWSNATETAEYKQVDVGGTLVNRLVISADEETPLAFTNAVPQTLGSGDDAASTASSVTFNSKFGFSPFAASAMPAIPEAIKAGLIVVAEGDDPDEAAEGYLYYVGYDTVGATNKWCASTAVVKTNDFADTAITISKKSADMLSVIYGFSDSNVITTDVKQANMVVSGIQCEGAGFAQALSGDYAAVPCTLTVAEITGLVCTNVTVNGEVWPGTSGVYANIPKGALVKVYFGTQPGYGITGDGIKTYASFAGNTTLDGTDADIQSWNIEKRYIYEVTGGASYASLGALIPNLKDGDVVTMLNNEALAEGRYEITNSVTFNCGAYDITGENGTNIVIAADVNFTVTPGKLENVALEIKADCTLNIAATDKTLVAYTLIPEQYARVKINTAEYYYNGTAWVESKGVTLTIWPAYPTDDPDNTAYFTGDAGKFVSDSDMSDYNDWVAYTASGFGYTFDGTFTNAAGDKVSLPTRYVDGVIYACGTGTVYTVTIEPNGGGTGEAYPFTTYSFNPKAETKITLEPPTPAPEDQVFDYWTANTAFVTINGNELTIPAGFYDGTGDITVTAQWKDAPVVEKYTVTFSTNKIDVASAKIENVESGTTLAESQVPEFTGGTWDVDPVGAVITCNTNFNYTIAAVAPVNPGDSHESTAQTEEEAKAEVQIGVDSYAKQDLATAGVSEDTYKGYFTKTVTGEPGAYTVKVELSTSVTNDVAQAITEEVKEIDLSGSTTAVSVSMPAAKVKPGLYYGIAVSTEVGSVKGTTPAAWTMATADGVSLTAEKPTDSTKAFYILKCSPTDTNKKN